MGQIVNFCAGVEPYVLPAKHVDAILVNVPDAAVSDAAINSTRRLFKIAGTQKVILDSGGFQLHVGEGESKTLSFDAGKPLHINDTSINLAPVHVMAAAAKLKPDIVMALDFPIRKTDDPVEQALEFMRKVGFNAIWARQCSELRTTLCPEVQLFLPIQCYDLSQLDQFTGMIPAVDYDGFSMPIRNLSDQQIILFMVRFYQMGIPQVHLLGTSTIFAIATAAYMARHYFDWVSLDATTWRKWADYSLYMNPFNLLQSRISSNMIIDESIPTDCQCPFCEDKTFTYIKNMPENERRGLLRCHNWWAIEKATRDLYDSSGNLIELERCLRGRGADSKRVDRFCNSMALADSLKNEDISLLANSIF
jgi:tRNA-guanine family transglycosylase